MASKKIFVVFGATGIQGGSVIKSMLDDPKAAAEFKLRGITRDPSKPNAQALVAKGVECVPVCPQSRLTAFPRSIALPSHTSFRSIDLS